ncbi:MAG TPA: 4-aminobutyrate--2-oxoglutarate transaminase [Candidatus Binataceae bacterium]|nr:4-aminobutyrate--2-oxoglutarate transaminase [Candidatus Binataceae bacterium]
MASNHQLSARLSAAVPRGISIATPMFVARAENAEVWDVEGRRYIDFAGGIAVQNIGHRHPRVMDAVRAQLDAFTHTAFQVTPYEVYVRLAERLNQLAPGSSPKKTIILSTGAEAIENAVKIARAATGRPAIISFAGGFHGRTMMALTLTGKINPYKVAFGPFPGDVFHARFPDAYRGVSVEQSLASIEQLFRADVEPSRVAAIIIEPVQGEGGFNIAPFEFMRALRELCDRHGILLIADEIQTGFGRTGKMFAVEHSGVAPDLITIAKAIGGGFPISAVIGRAEVMDAPIPGGLGSTFAGNAVSCAAGLAVLDVMEEEGILARAQKLGEHVAERLHAMQSDSRFACIGDVRGLGPMLAIEFVKNRASKTPAPELAKAVTAKAAERGLIVISCGVYSNVVRMLMPLTMSLELADEGFGILEAAMLDALAKS